MKDSAIFINTCRGPVQNEVELIEALNAARVQMHIHTNGDEASEVTLDALEAAN